MSAGLIRKSRKWDSATTAMRREGSGIERQVAGMVGGPGDVDALAAEYAWFQVDVELITCAGGPTIYLCNRTRVWGCQQEDVRHGGVADGLTI